MSEAKPIQVFNFWTYDQGIERPKLAPFKATREAIQATWNGKVAEGTAQLVDASDLDGSGRYRRIASGWGELA